VEAMIGALTLLLGQTSAMSESRPASTPIAPAEGVRVVEAESSLTLLQRARAGDEAARNALCERYIPRLQRWAHGRLPASARGALETVDLVQDTFIQVLRRLDDFEPRHPGAFQGYLRLTLVNRIRDEIRRVQHRGVAEALDTASPASDPSPLEQAIGQETLERYEAALARLKDDDREAVIMRAELGCSYAEIMEALDKPSIAATYMTVSRALVRLAQEMSRDRA
jgi:RNA polymerase sigma factor (sigma-70 family)